MLRLDTKKKTPNITKKRAPKAIPDIPILAPVESSSLELGVAVVEADIDEPVEAATVEEVADINVEGVVKRDDDDEEEDEDISGDTVEGFVEDNAEDLGVGE
jgi:hypothetical protein